MNTNIVRSILKLSIPIVLSNVLQSAYQLTDTFWVGRLGSDEVAAVSICFPIVFLLLSLGIGFSVAGTVLVSQYSGKKNQHMIDYVAGQTFFVMTVVSLLFSVLGYYSAGFIIDIMGVTGKVATDAIEYLEISFIGLFFMYAYLTFQSLLRGVGNVKTPFIIVFGTVVLNFFLDPIFIMGWNSFPAMGVSGAALATVITQGISAIIGIFILVSAKYGVTLRLSQLKPNWYQIKRIILLGSPASAEQSARALSMTLMTFLVTSFGANAIASLGLGIRILSFVIIPALGFSMATSTLVGKSIGAKDFEMAKNISIHSMVMIMISLTLIGIVFFFGAVPILRIFVPEAPDVIAGTDTFIKIMSLTFGLVGVQQVINGAFRGGGNTTLAMLLAIVTMWVCRFPLAYILAYHTTLKVDGIWWAFCISNIIAAIMAVMLFSRGRWIKELTDEDEKIETKIMSEEVEL
jgi:putative MATE family efflux protein